MGYDLNSGARTLVQTSFVSKFLSRGDTNSVIRGIIGAYVLARQQTQFNVVQIRLTKICVQVPGRRSTRGSYTGPHFEPLWAHIATGSGAVLAVISGPL